MKPKVIIALNTAWNLVNFRGGLIRALVTAGYEVITFAPSDRFAAQVTSLGAKFVALPMDNKGTNPGHDLLLLWRFYRLLQAERPAVYLGYTVKPNVYGSLAAYLLGIPVVNNIAGLGMVFIKKSYLQKLVRGLYRIALSHSSKVFFQNYEDREQFVVQGIVCSSITDILPGSGIDLRKFSYSPCYFKNNYRFRFLLVSRLLWDKGILEYVEASRCIKRKYPNAECCLLGFFDEDNSTSISRDQVEKWQSEEVISYLGVSDDVRFEIIEADCIVLPSYYREGTPRALLEGAAIGRPIITTDTIGCRDVVENGKNGFLCRPRDSKDLAEKMISMYLLNHEERLSMGMHGRKKMEREYDEKIVINKYLDIIKSLTMTQ